MDERDCLLARLCERIIAGSDLPLEMCKDRRPARFAVRDIERERPLCCERPEQAAREEAEAVHTALAGLLAHEDLRRELLRLRQCAFIVLRRHDGRRRADGTAEAAAIAGRRVHHVIFDGLLRADFLTAVAVRLAVTHETAAQIDPSFLHDTSLLNYTVFIIRPLFQIFHKKIISTFLRFLGALRDNYFLLRLNIIFHCLLSRFRL